jgi:uncharacterized protein YaaW (UPF0174 family)
MDKDLEFLNECTNDQLRNIADLLVYNEKGQKRNDETLSSRKSYSTYYPNEIKKIVPDIVDELQRYGGNKILNALRGHGIQYRNILEDICDQYKIKYNEFNTVDEVEGYLLRKLLLSSVDIMSEEDVLQISKDIKSKETLKAILSTGKLASPVILKMTTVMVYGILQKMGINMAAAIVGRFMVGRVFAFLAGPVGWVLGGAWMAYDLLGHSYKVTVPCVITMAYYRIINQRTEIEIENSLK